MALGGQKYLATTLPVIRYIWCVTTECAAATRRCRGWLKSHRDLQVDLFQVLPRPLSIDHQEVLPLG